MIALGWERLLEPQGVLDLLGVPHSLAGSLLYGPAGVILVLTAKGIPFAYLAISGALRGLGEEFEAAARVHGGGRAAAARMVASLLAPAVCSATVIVCFALRRRKLPTDEAQRRAHQALDQVGLDGFAKRYPHEMSGGQQQRVALARAIVARPGLLLFDEPLSNLDSDLRERLRVQISTLARDSGATAVYITHDQGEAFALADVVGVLNHGRLVQLAPPETVYQQPATPFVARFTGVSAELRDTVQSVVGSWVELEVAGATRVAARHLGTVTPGQEVTVLVRPSAPRIAAPEEANRALDGVVVDVAYRGRGYDHVVEVGDGANRTLITSVAHPTGLRRGERVPLTLDPEGCTAFPDADTDAATADVTL